MPEARVYWHTGDPWNFEECLVIQDAGDGRRLVLGKWMPPPDDVWQDGDGAGIPCVTHWVPVAELLAGVPEHAG